MITNLISSQVVISKLIADLDMLEENLRISDIQEWIGEAIGKIGGLDEISNTEAILPLCNGQVKLPCDLHRLNTAVYSTCTNGPWLPMRYSTGSFAITKCSDNCQCGTGKMPLENDLIDVYRTMYRKDPVSWAEARDVLYNNREMRIVLSQLLTEKDYRVGRLNGAAYHDLQYFTKPGYLVCNEGCGFIKISYSAIPRDDLGYAMIPNEESYIEAVYYYVVLKLKFPEYLRGSMPKYIYDDIRNSWFQYSNRAYGNLRLPNLDQMESIKNTWLKVYPTLDEHATSFAHLGEKEHIYKR